MHLLLNLKDAGDKKIKFQQLYEQYRHLMFYVAKDILKDEHLAEDAVQEALLRISKNLHKIDDVGSSKTRNFVAIVTRNVAITMANQRWKEGNIEFCMEKGDSTSLNISQESLDKTILEYVIQLPQIYRDSLYLYYIYGYSFREISQLLSVSVEVVKKRTQRARAMLKKMLEKEGFYNG